MADELKPCPFCGNADIVKMIGVRDERGHSMMCGKCGVRQGCNGSSMDQAIAAWNTRAPTTIPRPHCDTCGKDVSEVLCPTCAKWWADNPPPAEPTDAMIERFLILNG